MTTLVNLETDWIYHVNSFIYTITLHGDFFVCSLGDPFPEANVSDPQDERTIVKLMRFLETRIPRRELLQDSVREKRMNSLRCIFQRVTIHRCIISQS